MRAALLLVLLLIAPGCAEPTTMAAGAGLSALEYGVTTWIKRSLEAAEPASIERTAEAAQRALADLQFDPVVVRESDNGRWVRIHSADQQGRDVVITCTAIAPTISKIKVRVGLLGDQAVSIAIHREIQKRVAAAAQPVRGEAQAGAQGGSGAAGSTEPDGRSPPGS